MPKAKATKRSKIWSVLQGFLEELMKSPNNKLFCLLCTCTVSCNKCFLVESHRNTSKHQKALCSKSKLLIPHTLQSFLRGSNTKFVEKVIKAFFLLIFLHASLTNLLQYNTFKLSTCLPVRQNRNLTHAFDQ